MNKSLRSTIRRKAKTEEEIKSEIIIFGDEKEKYEFPISAEQLRKLEERKWIRVKDIIEILKDCVIVYKEELQVWCKTCNKWILGRWKDKLWHVKHHKTHVIIPREQLQFARKKIRISTLRYYSPLFFDKIFNFVIL